MRCVVSVLLLSLVCPHDGSRVIVAIVGVVVDAVSAKGVEEEEGRCFCTNIGVGIAFLRQKEIGDGRAVSKSSFPLKDLSYLNSSNNQEI